jgi:CubicO group peptidase (beta-lactamase class C family)
LLQHLQREFLPDRLARALQTERDAALNKAIPAAMERASIPGAVVGIWQDGRKPYVRAFGVSNTATGEPMTADMHMRIGSTTKSFVVTAILMLADQGKLNLDDTIDRCQGRAQRGQDNAQAACRDA